MIRHLLRIVWIALAVSAFVCDGKGPSFFLPGVTSPQVGGITGLISEGTTPLSGALVALSGTPARSFTTGSTGMFDFHDLPVGPYNITTNLTGYTCPPATVTVIVNETIASNVRCTRVPGAITGTVTLDGVGQPGVVVTITAGSTTQTATTGANGFYIIRDVAPGPYIATVTPPANATCTPASQSVFIQSGQTATGNFSCKSPLGLVAGVVRVNGSGTQGINVTLSGNGIDRTVQTDVAGIYSFFDVPPGSYSLVVTPPSGYTCTPNGVIVTVQSGKATEESFDCTAIPGGISGRVTLGDLPLEGVSVTVSQFGTSIASPVTTAAGTYVVTGLAPGIYTVTVTPPSGATCVNNPSTVVVQAGEQTTADFACTGTSLDFVVNFGEPAPSWVHIAPGDSRTCGGVITSPAQPGAPFVVTWLGPGVVGNNTRSGTLDANGKTVDTQQINQLGTYTFNAQVNSGGVIKQSSIDFAVTAAQGNCLP